MKKRCFSLFPVVKKNEKQRFRLCKKISVNSTTVIKNDIASGLKNSRSNFLQYTITTVICQVSSAVSLLEWSETEWEQTDCVGSVQSVGVHDLQLAKNSAPVEQKNIFCKFKKEVEGIFKRSRVEVEPDDSFKEETR